MVNENWDLVAEDLERQELQAQGGIASPEVYSKLLAIYLYQNDLNNLGFQKCITQPRNINCFHCFDVVETVKFEICNAKFLWKRIPSNIKSQDSELNDIWAVGKAMWQRDAALIYDTLYSKTWSESIEDIMKAIKDRVRERNIRLIGNAYSSINAEAMGSLLGLSAAEAIAIAKERTWQVDGHTIVPKTVGQPTPPLTSTEHQLHKLTSFVSFLEN